MSFRRAGVAVVLIVAVVAALVSVVVDPAKASASGCGIYQCTLVRAIAAINATDGAQDFAAWILGDFNRDGVLDLYGIKTKNTGSGDVEVHVLSGASGYKSWLLHAVVPISERDAPDFAAWDLGYYRGDTIPDLYLIKTKNTGSGRVEVHVLGGAANYSGFSLHATTLLSAPTAPDFASWQIGSNEPYPDLFAVKTGQDVSGRVEVHELTGSSNFSAFALHATTAFSSASAASFASWQIRPYESDGQPDLYGIATKNTGSGQVEVHVVGRSSNYQSFLLHATTSFPASTAPDYGYWAIGNFNGAGIEDLFGVQMTNTASGSLEVAVVNGPTPGGNCGSLNACTPQTFADAIFAYPGIDAPATASNEKAFEVWQSAEGGGAGCPGQPPRTSPWAYSAGPAGNPLNTTLKEPGSTSWNSVGVQIFQNYQGETCWYWGITAIANTLLNGLYGNILSVLLTPSSDDYTQCVDLAHAVGASPWGTGDFQADCSGLSAPRGVPALPAGRWYPAGQPGRPHYLVSVSRLTGATIAGQAVFVYQDGRTGHVAPFSGRVSPGGHVELHLANGATLSGVLSGSGPRLEG